MLSGHILSIVLHILFHFGYNPLYFLITFLVYLLLSPIVMVKSLSKSLWLWIICRRSLFLVQRVEQGVALCLYSFPDKIS